MKFKKLIRYPLLQVDKRLSAHRRRTWGQITDERLSQQAHTFHSFDFHEASILQPPNTIHPVAKVPHKDYQFKPAFAAEFRDARLIGNYAVPLSTSSDVIISSLLLPGRNRKEAFSSYSLSRYAPLHSVDDLQAYIRLARKAKLDSAVVLVNSTSRGYFHWMLEHLLRLQRLEDVGDSPIVIIPYRSPSFIKESLGHLSYEFMEWNYTYATVERLWVPSPTREEGRTSMQAVQWLKRRIFSISAPPSQTFDAPRILISRRKALQRRVTNEDALIAYLEPLGFQVFVLEDMPFLDQVALFKQAQIVIAPHGAGLTNVMFSEDAKVIEFFEPSYLNFCFYTLLSPLGHTYGYVIGESSGPTGKDIFVAVDDLDQLLRQMLILQ